MLSFLIILFHFVSGKFALCNFLQILNMNKRVTKLQTSARCAGNFKAINGNYSRQQDVRLGNLSDRLPDFLKEVHNV